MTEYERDLLNRSADTVEGLEKRASAAEAYALALENKLDFMKAAMGFVEIGKTVPYSDWEALEKDASALSDSNFDLEVLRKAQELHQNASPSMGKVATRRNNHSANTNTPEGRFEATLTTIVNGGN